MELFDKSARTFLTDACSVIGAMPVTKTLKTTSEDISSDKLSLVVDDNKSTFVEDLTPETPITIRVLISEETIIDEIFISGTPVDFTVVITDPTGKDITPLKVSNS